MGSAVLELPFHGEEVHLAAGRAGAGRVVGVIVDAVEADAAGLRVAAADVAGEYRGGREEDAGDADAAGVGDAGAARDEAAGVVGGDEGRGALVVVVVVELAPEEIETARGWCRLGRPAVHGEVDGGCSPGDRSGNHVASLGRRRQGGHRRGSDTACSHCGPPKIRLFY